MIKLISMVGVALLLSVFTTNYNDEEKKIITFSCGAYMCKDNETRCTVEKPGYMLDGACVKDGAVIDSLTPGAVKALYCNCAECGLFFSGSDNIPDVYEYLGKVNEYWIDDAIWKQVAENILLKTGEEAFKVVKIESIIINEILTSLNFTYLASNGAEEVAVIPMNVKL